MHLNSWPHFTLDTDLIASAMNTHLIISNHQEVVFICPDLLNAALLYRGTTHQGPYSQQYSGTSMTQANNVMYKWWDGARITHRCPPVTAVVMLSNATILILKRPYQLPLIVFIKMFSPSRELSESALRTMSERDTQDTGDGSGVSSNPSPWPWWCQQQLKDTEQEKYCLKSFSEVFLRGFTVYCYILKMLHSIQYSFQNERSMVPLIHKMLLKYNVSKKCKPKSIYPSIIC